MSADGSANRRLVPTYCYNCVSGPDLLTVNVVDGVAQSIEPNHGAASLDPMRNRPCVKAYGLIQKTYNPHRILTPMKRTNPRKGRNENPGFVAISWDEALDLIAAKMRELRARGLLNEQGVPRVAVTLGQGGVPHAYMGTFPALLAAWGSIDYSFGTGEGVKCVHSEHLYGEYWHRAFTVSADTPTCNYLVSFGNNAEVSGGVSAVARHAEARVRGIKRVSIEPHLSVTGACSARWIPIKPKTDAAFMFAMINVLLTERPREQLDVAFLRERTSAPYLVGPGGFYLRDWQTHKPLVWDLRSGRAVAFDAPNSEPALDGRFEMAQAVEIGPDNEATTHQTVTAETALSRLVEHVRRYTPEWAAKVCEVPAAAIREVANEFLDNACVGQTIEVDGQKLPYRPVAVTLGKGVNNGWGGYECCWGRTVLAVLVGALEVPGGILGTTVRLNRPHENRLKSVKPGPDGFMLNELNPTDPENWVSHPTGRNAHRTLVPLVGNSSWSQSLGPSHLSWLNQFQDLEGWQKPALPDLWFVYRANPPISFWDGLRVSETISRMPFTVGFAYTLDETNYMADVLLPEATDLESLQLIKMGGTKYQEYFCDYAGLVLRQPAVAPLGDCRDFTWLTTELARRAGLLKEYVEALNRGAGVSIALKGPDFDFSLDPEQVPQVEQIWDAACKAGSARLSGGREVKDLAWFKANGYYAVPGRRLDWYLYPTIVRLGLRFELPYQERILRSGLELGRRLHEQGIHWWDEQLAEYAALPEWTDIPGRWERMMVKLGARVEDYPFWMMTSKSMQYYGAGNASIQLMHEVASNVRGHGGLMMNARTAARMGIAEGDLLEIKSPFGVTKGRAILVQGIRPDTVLTIGQFDHWAMPFASEFGAPSVNSVVPMALELTDATGSAADLVRVSVRKMEASARSAGRRNGQRRAQEHRAPQ